MKSTFRAVILSGAFATLDFAMACGGGSQSTVAPSPSTSPAPSPGTSAIATDAALFKLLAQIDPFGSYSLFPNADAILSGTPLHGPMDRGSNMIDAIELTLAVACRESWHQRGPSPGV